MAINKKFIIKAWEKQSEDVKPSIDTFTNDQISATLMRDSLHRSGKYNVDLYQWDNADKIYCLV